MHIPDGVLSNPVWVSAAASGAAGLAACLRLASRRLEQRQAPLLGVMGAFVFAAQMVNFPVPGGSSGHLLGAVLLAWLLGPAAAGVVMFCVLLVQALLFQDGGVTALGANFINMGLVGVLWGGAARLLVARRAPLLRTVVLFAAAWLSVVCGALLAAVELWLSGRLPLSVGLSAIGGVHALIGVGEGLLTLAALRFLEAVRPGLLERTP